MLCQYIILGQRHHAGQRHHMTIQHAQTSASPELWQQNEVFTYRKLPLTWVMGQISMAGGSLLKAAAEELACLIGLTPARSASRVIVGSTSACRVGRNSHALAVHLRTTDINLLQTKFGSYSLWWSWDGAQSSGLGRPKTHTMHSF